MVFYENLEYAKKGTDILEWWSNYETNMPILAKFAMKYLAIPASSIKSERTFSTGSLVVDQKRTSLNVDKVEALIICKENMQLLENL